MAGTVRPLTVPKGETHFLLGLSNKASVFVRLLSVSVVFCLILQASEAFLLALGECWPVVGLAPLPAVNDGVRKLGVLLHLVAFKVTFNLIEPGPVKVQFSAALDQVVGNQCPFGTAA